MEGIKPTIFLSYSPVCWPSRISSSTVHLNNAGSNLGGQRPLIHSHLPPTQWQSLGSAGQAEKRECSGDRPGMYRLAIPSVCPATRSSAAHSGWAKLRTKTLQLTQLKFPFLSYLLLEVRRGFDIRVFSFCQSLLKLIPEGVTNRWPGAVYTRNVNVANLEYTHVQGQTLVEHL